MQREQIITLFNSTIRPRVAIAGPLEPADAYLCTVKTGDNYETLIYFHLVESNRAVVYHWEEGPQPRSSAKAVEKEAFRFLDEMGFQMDSLQFRKKSAEEQESIMAGAPLFRPLPASEVVEEAEEAEAMEFVHIEDADEDGEDIEEISLESLDDGPDVGMIDADGDVAEAQPAEAVEEAAGEFVEEAIEETGFEGAEEAVTAEAYEGPATGVEEAEEVLEQFEEVSLDAEEATEVVEEVGVPEPDVRMTESTAELDMVDAFDEAFDTSAEEADPAEPVVEAAAPPPPPPPPPKAATPPPRPPAEADPPQRPAASSATTNIDKSNLEGFDTEPLARFIASM